MNANNIFQTLCDTFQVNEINCEILKKLEFENVFKFQITIKSYLLQFLLDKEDKKANIIQSSDLWFIKEKIENENLIYNYIELMIKLIKLKKVTKINIFQELEIFLNSEIGNEIFLILSIVNKFFLPDIINLLFVGFVLGKKQNFIKKNYCQNLQDLLAMAESDIEDINSEMKIASINKEILETLNLYIVFILFKKKDRKSIRKLKNYLTNVNSETLDIYKYYQKLQKKKND